jgi:hypothetical protein
MDWKVNGDLETANIDGYQNVVVQVPWICTTTSQGVTVNMNGKTDLAYNPSNPFIQYQDLTETQVIGWVQSALGPDGVAFYETKTQEALDVELNDPNRTGTLFECFIKYVPLTSQPAPWSN